MTKTSSIDWTDIVRVAFGRQVTGRNGYTRHVTANHWYRGTVSPATRIQGAEAAQLTRTYRADGGAGYRTAREGKPYSVTPSAIVAGLI